MMMMRSSDLHPGVFLHPLTVDTSLILPQFWDYIPQPPKLHTRGVVVRDCVETTCVNCMCWCISLIALSVIVLTFWNKGAMAHLWLLFIIKILQLILNSRDHLKYVVWLRSLHAAHLLRRDSLRPTRLVRRYLTVRCSLPVSCQREALNRRVILPLHITVCFNL